MVQECYNERAVCNILLRGKSIFSFCGCFDYLSGSHLQSQVNSHRQMMVFMPLVIVLIGQFGDQSSTLYFGLMKRHHMPYLILWHFSLRKSFHNSDSLFLHIYLTTSRFNPPPPHPALYVPHSDNKIKYNGKIVNTFKPVIFLVPHQTNASDLYGSE